MVKRDPDNTALVRLAEDVASVASHVNDRYDVLCAVCWVLCAEYCALVCVVYYAPVLRCCLIPIGTNTYVSLPLLLHSIRERENRSYLFEIQQSFLPPLQALVAAHRMFMREVNRLLRVFVSPVVYMWLPPRDK